MLTQSTRPQVAIIGGGPAGLMAAEALAMAALEASDAELDITVYDGMPSVGRKFLLAGVGGMNITHSEAADAFYMRFGARREQLSPILDAFTPDDLRAWIHGLGIETFVGSSGRVFPREMKAAPLLRAWLHRLRGLGVRFCMRHRWLGWEADSGDHGRHPRLLFETPSGLAQATADVALLALGGASWSRLGSDGAWVPILSARGIEVAPLLPANCGFEAHWSEHFRTRFAGTPLKSVTATVTELDGTRIEKNGELMITEHGVEGSLIYALSRPLREALHAQGSAVLTLDLAPGRDLQRLRSEIDHPRGARSMASHLQSRCGIAGVKAGLLRECLPKDFYQIPAALAGGIKALPLRLYATRPIDEAISSAGGVRFEALDARLMLRQLPGVFCAGEMLDWEAPTGGYLLSATIASGRAAGRGAHAWLQERTR